MSLNLNHLKAIRRRRINGGMDYLLQAVRRELERRWELHKHTRPGVSSGNLLVVDFDASDLLNGEEVKRISVLDSATAVNEFKISPDSKTKFDALLLCLQSAWLDWDFLLTQALAHLRADASLLFCTFGPDTLIQIRSAWNKVDDGSHVHPFIDMHHLGDQLANLGFIKPVLDVERLNIVYPSVRVLANDLRAVGFSNILSSRSMALTPKTRGQEFYKFLAESQNQDGGLNITFEIIYGIAQAPQFAVPVRTNK